MSHETLGEALPLTMQLAIVACRAYTGTYVMGISPWSQVITGQVPGATGTALARCAGKELKYEVDFLRSRLALCQCGRQVPVGGMP